MSNNTETRYFAVSHGNFEIAPFFYSPIHMHDIFSSYKDENGLTHIHNADNEDVFDPRECSDVADSTLRHIDLYKNVVEITKAEFSHLHALHSMLKAASNDILFNIGNEAIFIDDDDFMGCLTRRMGTNDIINGMTTMARKIYADARLVYHRETCATIAMHVYPERDLRSQARKTA